MKLLDKFKKKIEENYLYMMSKKKKKDSYVTGFEQEIIKSYDTSSKEHIEPLLKYLRGSIGK